MSLEVMPTVRTVRMTPKRARELLIRNTHNRALRQPYVQRLTDAILRGEWELNGEPIQIASDGTLLNGQHRLSAIVAANRTVQVVVVEGIAVRAQDSIDTGARRRLADVLELRGEADVNNLAAALGLLSRYRRGLKLDNAGQNAPTAQQALALLDDEPGLRDSMVIGRRVYRETKLSQAVITVMYHLFAEVNEDDARTFMRLLAEDTDRPARDPIGRLQAFAARSRRDRFYRPTTYVLCAITIKAFNAWRLGNEITQLSFRPGGDSPETFPVIRRIAEEVTAS